MVESGRWEEEPTVSGGNISPASTVGPGKSQSNKSTIITKSRK